MNLQIEINGEQTVGTIRRLHGTNLAAPTRRQSLPVMDITEDIRELEIPLTRLHDAPLENGLGMVDVHHLFPLFHLDPRNPENYCFSTTDDYIQNCINSGGKIMYRLGESIEHSLNHYYTGPPEDPEKWTEICTHIIRHYNEGWARGFEHNIEYWEIWCEPDMVPKLWHGTWEEYLSLYTTAASKIKKRFPTIKIGGPAMGELKEALVRSFLSVCREKDVPLDFFSWHCYTDDHGKLLAQPQRVKKLLDEYGFSNTELHLNEWHYLPKGFFDPENWSGASANRRLYRESFVPAMSGMENAVFAASVLIGLQDTPVTMANHYVGTSLTNWGFFCSLSSLPNKTYYAVKAFNELTKYSSRLIVPAVPTDSASLEKDVRVLAGRKPGGETAALVVVPTGSASAGLGLKMPVFHGNPPSSIKVRVLDETRDLESAEEIETTDGIVQLAAPEGPRIYFVEAFYTG